MGITIGSVLIVILIALITLSRRNQKAADRQPASPQRAHAGPNKQFHAVSIQAADNACAAAHGMEGKRFLAASAPRIPLAECDAPVCKCRFVHHADRRSGIERRGSYVPGGLANVPTYTGRERRYRGDRRGNEPHNLFS